MLLAAMNPCQDSIGAGDSGYYTCSMAQKRQYYAKLSKPLLDRIDLQIEVKKVKLEEITSTATAENSSAIKKRVVAARNIQLQRFQKLKKKIFANGQMKNPEIKRFCPLDEEGSQLLRLAVDKFDLSARGYFKVLKVARTIADLEGVEKIAPRHVQEALQYRSLDLSQF
jgi:magnesium chelatase family protein